MSINVISPGLADVPIAETKISSIDGNKGILRYRGHAIELLASKSNFEEVAHLLVFNKLPNKDEFEQFRSELSQHRRLKYQMIDLIKTIPHNGHPMDATQALVAVLGMYYPFETKDFTKESVQWIAITRLIAKLPTLVAAFHRMRYGDLAITPRDDLGHSKNFLYMLDEKDVDDNVAQLLDASLILHMEHTMNASTFSSRVTASTLANPFTVISSAIGTLTGPLHGGANERVLYMLNEIGSLENVEPYLLDKLEKKEKIMGFGHREYRVKDPRAVVLQKMASTLFNGNSSSNKLYEIGLKVEEVMETLVGSKGIYPNVDFYSGLVYHKLGIPTDLFTPVFAIARVVGWLAHWVEQLNNNRIYRPTAIYIGDTDPPYISIEQRS